MNDYKLKEQVLELYNHLLVQMEYKNIRALELGFLQSFCRPQIFSMIIHSLENFAVLTEPQKANIRHLINTFNK